jgi:hypothetical protein
MSKPIYHLEVGVINEILIAKNQRTLGPSTMFTSPGTVSIPCLEEACLIIPKSERSTLGALKEEISFRVAKFFSQNINCIIVVYGMSTVEVRTRIQSENSKRLTCIIQCTRGTLRVEVVRDPAFPFDIIRRRQTSSDFIVNELWRC